MKRVLFILGLLSLSLTFVACSDDDDDKVISYDELPTKAQSFITTHFPDETKDQVKKDNDSYDVYLSKYKVEFDLSGEWDSVDGKRAGQKNVVPQSVLALIPNGILIYVAEEYPDTDIVEVDIEAYGYEVALNNNIDLKFDKEGSFLGLD